jgi:ABC-type microcin C transport system duplicated ATPase subunit YejF
MKPGRFQITNYSMGRGVASVELHGTIQEAIKRGETMEALGQPGSGKGAAAKSRIVGIKRLGD